MGTAPFLQTIRAVRELWVMTSSWPAASMCSTRTVLMVRPQNMWKFDPTEPVALVKMMVENGVDLLSNSGGNPYYIYPQVTRPL
ncbi:MAG: hypothetical protein ACLRI7_03175 [Ruthenibacterium lactatiformans]